MTSLVESAIQNIVTQVAVQFFAKQLVVSPQDKVDSRKKKKDSWFRCIIINVAKSLVALDQCKGCFIAAWVVRRTKLRLKETKSRLVSIINILKIINACQDIVKHGKNCTDEGF